MNLNNLGAIFSYTEDSFGTSFKWLYPIANFLTSILVPMTIIVLVAGSIWVIILGINLARAESADKATEAKKRLINVAVAIVASIVFVWLLAYLTTQVPGWFGSSSTNPIGSSTTTEKTTTTIIKSIF